MTITVRDTAKNNLRCALCALCGKKKLQPPLAMVIITAK
jgi:hypothetical protein